jgi:prepilin-type N-terminal cleavage/methylation domain-containing protein
MRAIVRVARSLKSTENRIARITMKKSGFSLIEILIVLAVIVIIVAMLAPAISSAKLAAKKTTTISNLRQCGTALAVYAADSSDEKEVPSIDSAAVALKGAPTCDPEDNWRTTCSESFGSPLVGSYAYVRGVGFFNSSAGLGMLRNSSNPVVMLSIFYARPAVPVFHGDYPPQTLRTTMPSGLIALRLDGSVSSSMKVSRPVGIDLGFSWPNAFFGSNATWVKLK